MTASLLGNARSVLLVGAVWLALLALLFRAAGRIYCSTCRRAFALFADGRFDSLCFKCWRVRRYDHHRRMRKRT